MASHNSEDLGMLLQAEYHYNYKTNNGRIITIEVGEEFILIKKSNSDWWQVIKQDQKKPFYVPAAYMKELGKHVYPDHHFFKKAYATLQKQKKKLRLSGDGKLESKKQFSASSQDRDHLSGSRENLTDLFSKSKFSSLRASCDSLDRFIENENPYDEVPFESKFSMPNKHDVGQESESRMKEDPEYTNLENIQSRISETHHRTSPMAERKESESPAELSRDQNLSNKKTDRENVVVYANTGEDAIRPRLPINQSTSTTVEVLEDGWELQLDNQSNSRYYLNPTTGEMRVKPPRRSSASPTTKHLIKKISADKIVPPAPPDVSKKPTLHRSNISPKLAEPPSRFQRQSTSPARLEENSGLPEVVDDEQDGFDAENDDLKASILKPRRIEPLKDNSNKVERRFSLKDRFFPDSEKKSKHKKAMSDFSSKSLPRSSAASSPSSSPKQGSEDIRLQATSGWIREKGPDGNIIYIRKSNGEKWHQMLDKSSGNYYYFNDISNQTSWQLPELDVHDEVSQPEVDLTKPEVTEDDKALIEKSSNFQDYRVRKASTIERDTLAPTSHNEFLPQSNSMPLDKLPPMVNPRTGFKRQAERVMMARSMIVLSDSKINRHPFDDSLQLDKSRLRHDVDPLHIPHPLIERQGRLNWTKLMEAGKKQRKNWVQQWVVLIANNLLFYKDQKQATMTKSAPHGKPDSSCELRGATIDWASDKSSKKNVVELQTLRGLSLLLQHDDPTTIQRWLTTIKATIERANQMDGDDLVFNPPLILDEEEENDSKKKKDKKKKKPTRHSSDAKNSENVRTRLRKFISRRPTIESLQERGIIKETVFGCPLDTLCQKENSTVPEFVRKCVEEVERRGLDVDGIYRVSGNLSHVQKLRYLVDRDEAYNLSDAQWDDIHLVTGALKMFLRELPEPVIPFNFFDKFIAACKIQDDNERINAMSALVSVLPKVNGDTLRYLMQHFSTVVEHSKKNRMHVQNIAIVFGPTLLLKPPDETRPEVPANSHMAIYMVYQNQIIDEMLTQYDRVFG